MDQIFGSRLVNKTGTVPASSLNGIEFILIYFSASWCPPCRTFTPHLIDFYDAVNSNRKVLEVVLVTSDKEERKFTDYYRSMPWLAIPFSNQAKIETLENAYEVTSIPRLVLINSDGTLAVDSCIEDVKNLGAAALDNWSLYKI
mmetsp:Transcript_34264/g.59984  ORF Transcript_34264/g.59984 Transcript_34264/m.59984 type:complete len:144 (+) Transcript_34264:2211-2642(+)